MKSAILHRLTGSGIVPLIENVLLAAVCGLVLFVAVAMYRSGLL